MNKKYSFLALILTICNLFSHPISYGPWNENLKDGNKGCFMYNDGLCAFKMIRKRDKRVIYLDALAGAIQLQNQKGSLQGFYLERNGNPLIAAPIDASYQNASSDEIFWKEVSKKVDTDPIYKKLVHKNSWICPEELKNPKHSISYNDINLLRKKIRRMHQDAKLEVALEEEILDNPELEKLPTNSDEWKEAASKKMNSILKNKFKINSNIKNGSQLVSKLSTWKDLKAAEKKWSSLEKASKNSEEKKEAFVKELMDKESDVAKALKNLTDLRDKCSVDKSIIKYSFHQIVKSSTSKTNLDYDSDEEEIFQDNEKLTEFKKNLPSTKRFSISEAKDLLKKDAKAGKKNLRDAFKDHPDSKIFRDALSELNLAEDFFTQDEDDSSTDKSDNPKKPDNVDPANQDPDNDSKKDPADSDSKTENPETTDDTDQKDLKIQDPTENNPTDTKPKPEPKSNLAKIGKGCGYALLIVACCFVIKKLHSLALKSKNSKKEPNKTNKSTAQESEEVEDE